METAIAVDRRHLALPDTCLFSPTELVVDPSLSQNEYSRLGKALSSVDQASDLWACDFAYAGQKRWGDEGLTLAAASTRLSVGYLKVSARIAERFDPARRFANLTREHYRGLVCFPPEFTDEWLPTVAEKGFGAKTIRALAVEAFGSDPKACYSKNKKRSVSIPETLYARLKESSPIPKTAVFIEQILSDFATAATPEQQARIAAALSTHARAAEQLRARRRKAKKPKVEKSEKIKEPADVKFQLGKFERMQESETPRPTYAERRLGAAPVSMVKRRETSIKIQMTPTCFGRNTKFNDETAAREAAAQYSRDKGYPVEAGWCEVCKAHHVRPAPLFP